MSKYYTPNLEEFHVGFRYEFQEFDSNKWFGDVFKEGQSPYGEEQRVKYLCKKDIEELGWVNIEGGVFKLPKESYNPKFGATPHMEIFGDNEVLITRGFTSYMGVAQGVVFMGKIKNYNELKRIMEQTGIIDETQ